MPRLAYMGHIILIAEEVGKLLVRCPPDLYAVIKDSFVLSEWEAFIETSLRETKARDARPLAGGKPMMPTPSTEATANASEDSSDEEEEAKFGEPLTRTVAADGFAPRPGFDTEGEVSHTSTDRAKAQSSWVSSARHLDSSDEDDDDADWLRPSANGRRGSDDDFGVGHNPVALAYGRHSRLDPRVTTSTM